MKPIDPAKIVKAATAKAKKEQRAAIMKLHGTKKGKELYKLATKRAC